MFKYVCDKENFKIGGFKPLKKGDELPRALINDLIRHKVKTGKGEVVTKLLFFTNNGFFKEVPTDG